MITQVVCINIAETVSAGQYPKPVVSAQIHAGNHTLWKLRVLTGIKIDELETIVALYTVLRSQPYKPTVILAQV